MVFFFCGVVYFIVCVLFGGSGGGASSHVDDMVCPVTVSHHLLQYVTKFTVCTNTTNLPTFKMCVHSLTEMKRAIEDVMLADEHAQKTETAKHKRVG